ncbi:alpha-N-acetylneuraminate alpha-2,8-sialyltransferase ST8SIA3-like [Amphiura filiformis]|uniref:alpha-N-acetylneuraminate alpha-2,8-sialyltransferase ST8SIA3-like n=1 Tax=Amphiura filiformis TaxID=82378 RepID=UPI003B20FDE5
MSVGYYAWTLSDSQVFSFDKSFARLSNSAYFRTRALSVLRKESLENKTSVITATVTTPQPPVSDRLSQLILGGEELVCNCNITDNVMKYLRKSSGKGQIKLKKLEQLRLNILDVFRKLGMKHFNVTKDFLMTQDNCAVNSSFRLYKYPKAKPIQLSQDFCNTLPEVSPFADRVFNVCSIVGSSGILSKSRCGKKIDKADFVFRINDAPTKGFEKDVGSVTNMRSLNGGTLQARNKKMKCYANKTHFNTSIGDNYQWIRIPQSHKNKAVDYITSDACQVFESSEGQVIIGNPKFEVAIIKYWQRYGIASKMRTTITSGLYVLSHALFMCNHIHLYGFWPFSSFLNKNNVRYHYYNRGRKGKTHTWNEEFEMLLRLHNSRTLDLHITC